MQEGLPKEIFRNFRNNIESQIITWINVIGKMNSNPDRYYNLILKQIEMGGERGQICLQFLQKMGNLGRLINKCDSLFKIFEVLINKILQKSVTELQFSKDIEVVAILLLTEDVNKKYFSFLRESCLTIFKEEANQHYHPLAILNYFLKKLQGSFNQLGKRLHVDREIFQTINDTLLYFRNLSTFKLKNQQKLDYFLQIVKRMLVISKKSYVQGNFGQADQVIKNLPRQICIEQLQNQKVVLIKNSQILAERIFQMLSISSFTLFASYQESLMESQILLITQKYILTSSIINNFWVSFLENIDISQHIPIFFSTFLFENYYFKPKTIQEAVNKLKITQLIRKCSSMQAKSNEIEFIRRMSNEQLNNPQTRNPITLLRIALESLYRPNISLKDIQKIKIQEQFYEIDEMIKKFFQFGGMLQQIEILNLLPIVKIFCHTQPALIIKNHISKNVVFFLLKLMGKHKQQPFCEEISDLLSLIFKIFKKQYMNFSNTCHATQFRCELDELFSNCLKLVQSEFREESNLGKIGRVLEQFVQVFVNMGQVKICEQILCLIQQRYGYYDDSLDKICRKQLSTLIFQDSNQTMIILRKINSIVICSNRPLYFSLLLDFAEKNKQKQCVKVFLLSKRQEMNQILQKFPFQATSNIRYLNTMVLIEATQNQINDQRLSQIASGLRRVREFLGTIELQYDKIVEIVFKSISSMKKKSKSNFVSFSLALPFLEFLIEAILALRDKTEKNYILLGPQELSIYRIVLKLSHCLRNLVLSVKQIHFDSREIGRKCEEIMISFAEETGCHWIQQKEISITYRTNFIVSIFWLKHLAKCLPQNVFPYISIVYDTKEIHQCISEKLKKIWNLLVPLITDPTHSVHLQTIDV